ncbi:MAG: hypothetical protein AMJ43_00250 [Coxiella sp. DG_40]|nr:MAG: hypothetical protein AMJ43_00250 [Coxiella sp. DG_40]
MNVLRVPKRFSVTSRTTRFMLYTLFGLIVADGLITQFLVTNGYASEVNPFLQAWVSQDLFLAIKISGAFLVTLLLWVKYNARPKLIYRITAVFLIFYTSIVFWNLFVCLHSQL